MDRISVRALATAIRFLREPVVVTYSYPRNHPLHGAGEETGVYIPLSVWQTWPDVPEIGTSARSTYDEHRADIPEIVLPAKALL